MKFQYTITEFDAVNKKLLVVFDDNTRAMIQLSLPLPTNAQEVDKIVCQFTATETQIAAAGTPSDLGFIDAMIGVMREANRLPNHPFESGPPLTPRQQIDAQRDAKLAEGTLFNGKRWHTDDAFQTQLTALISAFNNGIIQEGATVGIRTMSNRVEQVSKQQLIELAAAVLQYVQGVYAWSWMEKDKLPNE